MTDRPQSIARLRELIQRWRSPAIGYPGADPAYFDGYDAGQRACAESTGELLDALESRATAPVVVDEAMAYRVLDQFLRRFGAIPPWNRDPLVCLGREEDDFHLKAMKDALEAVLGQGDAQAKETK